MYCVVSHTHTRAGIGEHSRNLGSLEPKECPTVCVIPQISAELVFINRGEPRCKGILETSAVLVFMNIGEIVVFWNPWISARSGIHSLVDDGYTDMKIIIENGLLHNHSYGKICI